MLKGIGQTGCCAPSPLGSSQFLGALRVHGHGPVHAAGEALLQQELRDVAILMEGRRLVRTWATPQLLLKLLQSYRVEDGSQDDLVGAALQDDLDISL